MINAVIVRSVERVKGIGAKSAQWMAQEQHRASFETGANTSVSSSPEVIRVDNSNAMLNGENHPAAGISDFSGDETVDNESAEQVPAIESVAIKTTSVQNGQGTPSGEKRNGRKGNGKPKQERAVKGEDESEPTEVEYTADLDTTGWGANYDLPR
jgi:hypothetical protein